MHACSRYRHWGWIWVRLGADLAPEHHHWPYLAHVITQRLLVQIWWFLVYSGGQNELFKMNDFRPMTSGTHWVHVCSRYRHWIVRLGADLVGLTPEYDPRTLPSTLPCTCDSLTPIGPFDVQTGCIWSAECALQDTWFLAYDVRCALSACMFKI